MRPPLSDFNDCIPDPFGCLLTSEVRDEIPRQEAPLRGKVFVANGIVTMK